MFQATRLVISAYAFAMYPSRTHYGPINHMLAMHTAISASALLQILMEVDGLEERLQQAVSMLNDPTGCDDSILNEYRKRLRLCLQIFYNSFTLWRRADLPHAICRIEEEGGSVEQLVTMRKWLDEGVGKDQAAFMLIEVFFLRIDS